MFEHLDTNDLVRIAAAGGGFSTNAGFREVNDLIRIASAAGVSGAKLTFQNLTHLSTEEIIRISAAGKGNIVFEKKDK